MEESTIALFCCLHDFARMFSDWERHKLIGSDRQRRRAGINELPSYERFVALMPRLLLGTPKNDLSPQTPQRGEKDSFSSRDCQAMP